MADAPTKVTRSVRSKLVDQFADKIEELVEHSQGKVRADVVHDRLVAMGFAGNERTRREPRNLQRAVTRLPWLLESVAVHGPSAWLAAMPRRERHLVCAQWSEHTVKLVQIQFLRDGIAVHFAYQPEATGLMAQCVLRPAHTETVDLLPVAKSTSHRVKYTQHIDGACHFSQDQKIITSVRNAGMSLDASRLHLFSMDAEGLSIFAPPPTVWPSRYAHSILRFSGEGEPPRLHVAAGWNVEAVETVERLTNPLTVRAPDGSLTTALGLAPAPGSPLDGSLLMLRAQPCRRLNDDVPFRLLFTAGFPATIGDANQESSMLVLHYPADKVQGLSSIDYTPSAGPEALAIEESGPAPQ